VIPASLAPVVGKLEAAAESFVLTFAGAFVGLLAVMGTSGYTKKGLIAAAAGALTAAFRALQASGVLPSVMIGKTAVVAAHQVVTTTAPTAPAPAPAPAPPAE